MKKFIAILSIVFIAQVGLAAITFTPSAIDSGYCETAYSCKVTATGGKAPYVYKISSGVLPVGLTINKSTGRISGIIHLQRDTSITFTVRATDALSATATKVYTMYISNSVVGWADIVSYWQKIPNTFPNYTQIYNTWRLNSSQNLLSISGNLATDDLTIGTTNNYNLDFITNDKARVIIDTIGRVGFGDTASSFFYEFNATDPIDDGQIGMFSITNSSNTGNPIFGVHSAGEDINSITINAAYNADYQINVATTLQRGQYILNNRPAGGTIKTYCAYYDNTGSKLGDNTALYVRAINSSGKNYAIESTGRILTSGIPTDSTTCAAGEIYNLGGTLKIKY